MQGSQCQSFSLYPYLSTSPFTYPSPIYLYLSIHHSSTSTSIYSTGATGARLVTTASNRQVRQCYSTAVKDDDDDDDYDDDDDDDCNDDDDVDDDDDDDIDDDGNYPMTHLSIPPPLSMSRLQREGQRYALLTACADGGLAHACILERYDNNK